MVFLLKELSESATVTRPRAERPIFNLLPLAQVDIQLFLRRAVQGCDLVRPHVPFLNRLYTQCQMYIFAFRSTTGQFEVIDHVLRKLILVRYSYNFEFNA